MASNQKVGDKIKPIYVLLPLYTELKEDVFLDILKKVVSRTRFGEGCIERAFSSGMSAKTVLIKSNDLTVNENDQMSMLKKVRIMKLLGFWAVNNFPSLGRKLLGDHWQPSKDRTVNIENIEVMNAEQIDEHMFMKFKLRVIELSVSVTTWIKVKDFVAVPIGVCDKNPDRKSKKMVMFGILDARIHDCWQALKIGKMVVALEQPSETEQHQSAQLIPTVENATINGNGDSVVDCATDGSSNDNSADGELISTVENATVNIDVTAVGDLVMDCAVVDFADGDSTNHETGNRGVVAAKRSHAVIHCNPSSSNLVIGSHPVSATKRSRLTMDLNSCNPAIDDLRVDVQTMTHAIAKLTNRFDSEAELIAHLRNTLTESDRKYQQLSILNGKLLDNLNVVKIESDRKNQELRMENGKLLENLNIIKAESERKNHELTNVNEKLLECLNVVKAESDRNEELTIANQKLLADLKFVKAESDRKEQELRNENGKLLENFNVVNAESERKNYELTSVNEKLLECLNVVKAKSDRNEELTTVNEKLLEDLNVMKSCGEHIKNNFDQKNVELMSDNGKLQEQLNAAKNYGIESDKKKMEMVSENTKLLDDLNITKSFIDELKKNVAESNQKNAVLAKENEHLWLQLNEMRNQFETLVPELNKQIQSLNKNIDETSSNTKSEVENNGNKSHESAHASMKEQQLLLASTSKNDNALNTDNIFSGNVQPSEQVKITHDLAELNDEMPQSSTEQEHISESNWEPVSGCYTDDPIVLACRDKLMKLPFQWLKFQTDKKAKFYPGFIHPTAAGGKPEAQKVMQNGYPTSKKYEFFDRKDKLVESERSLHKNEMYALNSFNKKFESKFQ